MNKTLIAACLLASGLFVAACEEQGPMERTGEKIDETAENMGDAMEDAGEDMEH